MSKEIGRTARATRRGKKANNMEFTIEKVRVTEKSRKLKGVWKFEITQPLQHWAELDGVIYTNMEEYRNCEGVVFIDDEEEVIKKKNSNVDT